MIRQARISLISFAAGATVLLFPAVFHVLPFIGFIWEDFWHAILMIHFLICNGAFSAIYVHQRDSYRISVRAGNLGIVFGLSFLISIYSQSWQHFGWYIMTLTFFHWSEYETTALTNPSSLTLESFLLDHSREYKMAAAASCAEFIVEGLVFPGMKHQKWISTFGLILTVGGELLRKASMFTARTNFNHHIQHTKQDGHILVTRGVYSLFRHPSYVGWFAWSIGTQIMLCNPFCLIGYTIVSWRFFNERITEEEIYLLNFFGEDYLDYQKKVPTGIPFVRGYRQYL
ncbi:protein-S-isoprenylcysteine O-methyltransferase [Biomphalaria pfeifferi]|uniref:Protein-S-isoprenylcysteine O-methyltransferase n=1 Tax=Biomphalaria pfeifferi TaxID=112525 RepID=A0AAD8BLF1_BIOPF|nr:protein-S-isoprenylcysteine O-methyltransferase [Biomphalaria pfeifferi]